ncbi:hypothetical protein D3C72_2471130 [compost metagenome]
MYILGIGGTAGALPSALSFMGPLSAVLLLIHGIEAIVMFKHVKHYPGSLGMSLVLTLLFGFLHWKPLMQASQRS